MGNGDQLISRSTAEFLLDHVNGLTLSVGAPDFDEALTQVLRARQELQAIVSEQRPTPTDELPPHRP